MLQKYSKIYCGFAAFNDFFVQSFLAQAQACF